MFTKTFIASLCCLMPLFGQEAAVAIATGYADGVLLKRDGTVWTWGSNSEWEPTQVVGFEHVVSIAAGSSFSLALKNDGTVWAWGHNEDAGLKSAEPVQVAGLPRVNAIAASENHAMALDDGARVWEWGAVFNRRSLKAPALVPGLANVTQIAAGDHHNIALDREGTVWVWGDHGAGDLGDGCYNCSGLPQRLKGLSDVAALAGGYEVTIALKKDGTVWAVGYGAAGQLGDGTARTSLTPVMVTGLTGVKAVAARYMNVMALKSDGTVWGWGSNHYRQLGNAAFNDEDAKKPVRAGTLRNVVAIVAGEHHAAAVTADGDVWTWGDNTGGALGADPEDLSRSDVPMHPGTPIPPECQALFVCGTAGGKVIRICGTEDPSNIDKWTGIHYRFGPETGPPELMFPADPENAPPSLYFLEDSVRFTNGAYTYRVYFEGRVTVDDAKGKRLSSIECAERPQVYIEYLRENLPCRARSGLSRPCAVAVQSK